MSTYQQVTILGRLGRDPEKRSAGGSSVCNFSVATDESYKNRDGGKVERTEWHSIVAWGPLGDRCHEYLRKGALALIVGKLQTREYEDRNGNKKKATEVVAHNVTFVGGRKDNEGGHEPRGESSPASRRTARETPPDDDDIPF